jgi:hypothetical protein
MDLKDAVGERIIQREDAKARRNLWIHRNRSGDLSLPSDEGTKVFNSLRLRDFALKNRFNCGN